MGQNPTSVRRDKRCTGMYAFPAVVMAEAQVYRAPDFSQRGRSAGSVVVLAFNL
jgi:hypothetical protein